MEFERFMQNDATDGRRRHPVRVTLVALAALSMSSAAWADYREVRVKGGGTITGNVTFHGELPGDSKERFQIPGKSPGCGTGFRKVVRIDVKNGGLRGSFVMIEGISASKKWPKLASPLVLAQKDCRFLPPTQMVRKGTKILVRNSDSGVLHNVNLREIKEFSSGRVVRRMLFNIAQPDIGDVLKKVKPRKSPFLVVGCDVHAFMSAHILAPEHPYAAVVRDDGSFVLDDVPPGQHTLLAWHPKLGKKRISVTVPANGKVDAVFKFGR